MLNDLMELNLSIRALYTLQKMGVYTVQQLKTIDLATIPSKKVRAELATINY